jgi:hypothetical protein
LKLFPVEWFQAENGSIYIESRNDSTPAVCALDNARALGRLLDVNLFKEYSLIIEKLPGLIAIRAPA